jgi:hypothetical protein
MAIFGRKTRRTQEEQDGATIRWYEGAGRNADGIRDHVVQAARHEAEIELAPLRIERRHQDERETLLQEEINWLGKTEARGKRKRRGGMIWLVLFIFALLLTMGAVLWGSQIMELSPWKQSILLSAVVLSVAGFEGFFRNLRRLVERPEFRKWMLNISVITVLCGLFGAGSLAVSRGLATRMEAKQSNIVGFSDSDSAIETEQLKSIQKTNSVVDIAMVLTLLCFAIGGEFAAGLTFFEMRRNFDDAAHVLGLYGAVRDLQKAIVENERNQEAARQRPEILHHELTAGKLYAEAKEEERTPPKAEDNEAVERRNGNTVGPNGRSVGSTIRMTVIAFIAIMGVLGGFVATLALAADTVVVGVDRSTSSDVNTESNDNLAKVEEIIRTENTPGTRIVILGIIKDSFGSPTIFDDAVPLESGRFGQRLEEWRLHAIKKWRVRKESLTPSENGSDIFGFLSRAALVFADDPNGKKRLIVLSDMRHFGQGYNFENMNGLAKARIDELDAQGLVPKLQGVKVWILGAHTNGLSPAHWMKLKDFWTEYLKRSGAELMIFSPSRRVPENSK